MGENNYGILILFLNVQIRPEQRTKRYAVYDMNDKLCADSNRNTDNQVRCKHGYHRCDKND